MQKLIQEALANKRETLLRKREVLRMTGLSNSTFYNRIKEGVIPSGVPCGLTLAWQSDLQYNGGVVVPLPDVSDDTRSLTTAALTGFLTSD